MDVGVIGVGAMGRNHVRVYSELKGVDTVYVYDPVPENAERIEGVCHHLQLIGGATWTRWMQSASVCRPGTTSRRPKRSSTPA